MAASPSQACSHCQELQQQLTQLQEKVASLQAELAAARKHSGNSSKPPSSDITAPPKHKSTPAAATGKRKRGGQPGHPRHQRTPFEPQQLSATVPYRLDGCPCCGGGLCDADLPPKVQQQVEIPAVPVTIVEHQQIPQWCSRCKQVFYATLPEALVKAGLVGPRLTALVGFLKGACHMSFSSIRKFFRDVLGIPVSRGLLTKLIHKVSVSLQDPYEELLGQLPTEDILNVDETGHKDSGKRLWTWCFRASLYTLFKISPSRGSEVLVAVLGEEFDGVLGSDYFSAYRKYMKDFDVTVQFCLAHFIRDVKFLAEHPDARNRAYGALLLGHLRKLFGIIHRRDEYATAEGFRRALGRVRNDLVLDAKRLAPETREADNLAERFYRHGESYFTFITTPGVEPTNNLAEQAIRFVAIHRRLTQGTRGETGQTWCERIWTVVLSCGQQARSVFDYLCEAVQASMAGEPAPSLLPNTS
jgi:transposase